MLHRTRRRVWAPLLPVAAAALAPAATANAATTYQVSGRQIVVDEAAGKYTMQGGLIGDWSITSFTEIAKAPLYKGKGTELFVGCLDVRRDGSCKGDPAGKLRFRFRYWASFDAQVA